VVLGCAATAIAAPDSVAAVGFREMADQFSARFSRRLDPAWPWPEAILTYENALPARALIVAGQTLRSDEQVDTGLRVLDWQLEAQTATDGHLSPIGNGWWSRGGAKSHFDQQPIEATALILAAWAAFGVTADDAYRTAIERAYAWFLGGNDLGLDVADPDRGAGYDGLTVDGINTNQGAESTLMWHIAAEHVRASRAGRPTVAAPTEMLLAGSIA
jgi:hypothetical protein